MHPVHPSSTGATAFIFAIFYMYSMPWLKDPTIRHETSNDQQLLRYHL